MKFISVSFALFVAVAIAVPTIEDRPLEARDVEAFSGYDRVADRCSFFGIETFMTLHSIQGTAWRLLRPPSSQPRRHVHYPRCLQLARLHRKSSCLLTSGH